jgi:hemerythrin superfamily protein
MPNGIELILADHRRVDALFEEYAQSGSAIVIGEIIDALQAHDDAEQAALYPLAGHLLGDAAAIQRWATAHSAVKQQIDLLKSQEGHPLVQSVEVLRLLVQEHVKDEEQNLLPALGEEATAAQLDGLGARLLQAKQRGG